MAYSAVQLCIVIQCYTFVYSFIKLYSFFYMCTVFIQVYSFTQAYSAVQYTTDINERTTKTVVRTQHLLDTPSKLSTFWNTERTKHFFLSQWPPRAVWLWQWQRTPDKHKNRHTDIPSYRLYLYYDERRDIRWNIAWAWGTSWGLRLYFTVHPNLSHNTDILNF